MYADTLALATRGYWTERKQVLLSELTLTVVDTTAFTVTITCEVD